MVIICNYSRKNIVIISLIITSIIFIFLNQKIFSKYNEVFENSMQITIPDKVEVNLEKSNSINNLKNSDEWKLEIPKISLCAKISEGTTSKVMDKYIGHFMETSKDNGNVGLAAHNRGYKVNYFSNLKKLENGDLVIYTYKGKSQKYTVTSKEIIKDTDWSKLENSKVNKLTMITCVENKPEYRLCVQATEIEN